MNNQTDEQIINLAKETLTGDLRDFIIDRLRQFPKTWQQMTEDEQQSQIEQASVFCEALVDKAVKIISSAGRQVVHAEIGKIVVDKGIKAEIRVSSSYADELIAAQGQPVLIVTNSSDAFVGEKGACLPDPQEPELFNGEYREDDGTGIPQPLALPNPEPIDAEFEQTDDEASDSSGNASC